MDEWEIQYTDEWFQWFTGMDRESKALIADALDRLAQIGPNLGRPLVDRIRRSSLHNLKELRPASTGSSEVRILFVFDPWRSAILLVGGDKSGHWNRWYATAIPEAEWLYEEYLMEKQAEIREEDRLS